MSATAIQISAPADPTGSGNSAFTGTGTLLRLILRRDRIRVPAWILGIAIVMVGGAASYPGLYPTAADRAAQADIFESSPAMKAMTGPGNGAENYTYGAMMTNEYLGFMVIFAALMSVFMVVRHTRAEEEDGRAELVRACVAGRHAHLTSALLAAATANAVLGVLIAAGMASLGIETIDWPGSVLFGASFAAVGLVFAALAAVTAQISEYARAASGMAGALIGVAYVLRAIGDVAGNGLSWLSPIGWVQATAAYVDNNWLPIALSLVVTAILVALAFRLGGRRDTGAGLRAERPGAPTASRALGTPEGFAWRLHRSAALWWAAAMFVSGAAYGSAVNVIEDYADNQVVADLVKSIGGANLTESWLSMIISLLSIVCAIFAVSAALRPRREETSGRAEGVLATAMSRTRWVGTHIAVGMGGGLALLLVTGAGLGLGSAAASGNAELFSDVLGATAAYAPALWVTAGLAVFAMGWLPRATAVAWALIGYAILIVYLGGLLGLPDWMIDVSPFSHIPHMPAAHFQVTPLVLLTLTAAALVALGLAGFRRRDVEAS